MTRRRAANRFSFAFNEALPVHSLRIEFQNTAPESIGTLLMHNLTFDFFDDSGISRGNRILMFYSFETDDRLARSGILHYHVDEHRFVGPRHDRELTDAALAFLSRSGRLPESNA